MQKSHLLSGAVGALAGALVVAVFVNQIYVDRVVDDAMGRALTSIEIFNRVSRGDARSLESSREILRLEAMGSFVILGSQEALSKRHCAQRDQIFARAGTLSRLTEGAGALGARARGVLAAHAAGKYACT